MKIANMDEECRERSYQWFKSGTTGADQLTINDISSAAMGWYF